MKEAKEPAQVEELMKPRFKVIADYPLSKFKIGDVFEYDSVWVEKLENYPHLFKRLAWYEDRKPEEMPEYVKHSKGGYYHKVMSWQGISAYGIPLYEFIDMEGKSRTISLNGTIPATLAEYTQYINSKQ